MTTTLFKLRIMFLKNYLLVNLGIFNQLKYLPKQIHSETLLSFIKKKKKGAVLICYF